MKIKVLITCMLMVKNIQTYDNYFKKYDLDYTYLNTIQTLSENELIKFVPNYDVWITGDDPATYKVLFEGKKGKLKMLVKWGVGIDNVDKKACEDLDIYFTYTPCMFGEEVSDVAIGYLLMLNRKLHEIDTQVKNNIWYKPTGNSLYGKKVCVIGFGDIGKCVVKKLHAFNTNIFVSDPIYEHMTIKTKIINKKIIKMIDNKYDITFDNLNNCMLDADFVIITCNLNKETFHLINKENLILCKKGAKIINVSRGNLIKENDLIELLQNQHINCVALDVFETEPLPKDSHLRLFKQNIFGSHNASNTKEGVDKTSFLVIDKIVEYFNLKHKSNL